MEGESRTRRKKQRKELEGLGKRLAGLPVSRLRAASLPDGILEEVLELQRLERQAMRRQERRLAGRLQQLEVDELEQVRQLVGDACDERREDAERFQLVELWRERLLGEGESALDVLCDERPEADRERLRRLVQAALKDREQDRAAHSGRRLFRHLRELLDS